MQVLENAGAGEPVERYAAKGVSSLPLADGDGEAHVYLLRFEPGGRIGRHPTGFAQLFYVVEGSGWVAGQDGRRRTLVAGQAALFGLGEDHAKGSDEGMSALMVQVRHLCVREDGAASR